MNDSSTRVVVCRVVARLRASQVVQDELVGLADSGVVGADDDADIPRYSAFDVVQDDAQTAVCLVHFAGDDALAVFCLVGHLQQVGTLDV